MSRRRTGWEEGPGIQTLSQFTTSTAAILGAGQSFNLDGFTIVRIRGLLDMFLTTATANGSGFVGAFGIGIVTDAAFAVGITAVPTPLTEIEWEGWMYHQFISVHGPAGTTAFPAISAGSQIVVDTKAMRKIGSDEVLMAVIEVTEDVADATLNVRFGSRMLLKLP